MDAAPMQRRQIDDAMMHPTFNNSAPLAEGRFVCTIVAHS
jgi:hypothetical protein